MPFEVMDHRGSTTASSHYFEDIHLPAERQIGFWNPNTMPDHQGGPPSMHYAELSQSILDRDKKDKSLSSEQGANMCDHALSSMDHHPKSWSSLSLQPASYSKGRSRADISASQWENSLFSSSFSEIFSRKLRFSGNDIHSHQPAKTITSSNEEEEPFESLEELEAKTIGNLLPPEDNMFSGVTTELGHDSQNNNLDGLEDFDLFSSGGGMELEGEGGQGNSGLLGGVPNCQGDSNGSTVVGHPSRTLFVRNINSNVEDSELKAIFEQFGDIQTLYTACKHRGFVMVSYYDIRAARNAMNALQNKPLRCRKLDIHYSIPKDNPSEKDMKQGTLVVFNLDSSISIDELHQIFGVYGEIKEIRESPQRHHDKFIEYYDIRDADAALSALNRSDIAGKQIKVESSLPGGTRSLMQQSEHKQTQPHPFQRPFKDLLSGSLATFSPGVSASSYMENRSTQVLHSAIPSQLGAFTDLHCCSSVSINLPSPVTASAAKQISVSEMKFGNQCIPSTHPHSLPEYHDSLANTISYNSPRTIRDMPSSFTSKVAEGINSLHIQGVGSNGHLMERIGGVSGSPGAGSCSLPGHHYVWKNSKSGQQHPSSGMIWPNSPSFVNGVHAHHLPHMPGFPRGRAVMLNSAPAPHHIGSAPAVNPSLWEMQHTFSGESPDTSSFHLGSLGSVGFPGSSPPHPVEIASHNIFSHVGRSCMDMTNGTVLPSSPQMCHMFPGRNSMIAMPASFGSPNERVRNLSHRRIESNSNHSDKKLYELDIDCILRGEDSRTTLMIKNIPNKYTSKMLLAAIDDHCRGTYDFIYLPIDFKNKCNVGYAFINMIDPQQIIPFHKAFNGKKWEKFNSEKVASLAYARIQGKAALIAHFQNSSLMNEDKRCRPILFHTDGPNAGDPEPFPMGTHIRSRLGKPQSTGNEENHHSGSLSTLANEEDCPNGIHSPSGSDYVVFFGQDTNSNPVRV
ncbi:protein MEI2-like 1 isoform X1 [Populus nigra]|uniref:protein MEI2-like 1 isoform X1 n=1 Tax=Populus nigra TaxID=3691 RepID=UPI002B266547|nr:protein MEI2-like 1 isoform X1 [Populus nigra]XP_061956372.1 protein MEI2-like 1 isoform X1 [Populus nigra]